MTTQSMNASVNEHSECNSTKISNEDNNSIANDSTISRINQSAQQVKKVVKLSQLLEKRGPRKVAARKAKARVAAE